MIFAWLRRMMMAPGVADLKREHCLENLGFDSESSEIYASKDRSVVLKVFKKNLEYRSELAAYERVKSIPIVERHVPRLLRFSHENQFLLIEYRGRDAIELLNDGEFTRRLWRQMLVQLIGPLEEMARNSLAHADIKPENITYDGSTWSFIDLCYMQRTDLPFCGTSFRGTLQYCSPVRSHAVIRERIAGRAHAARLADQYSFAMTALSILGILFEDLYDGARSDGKPTRLRLDLERFWARTVPGPEVLPGEPMRQQDDRVLCALCDVVLSHMDPVARYLEWSTRDKLCYFTGVLPGHREPPDPELSWEDLKRAIGALV